MRSYRRMLKFPLTKHVRIEIAEIVFNIMNKNLELITARKGKRGTSATTLELIKLLPSPINN